MKPEVLALISALGGIVIGTIGNVLISVFTKRYEHSRELKKLVFTSAIEQWKEMVCQAKEAQPGGSVAPIGAFILQNSMLLGLVGDKNIDEKKLRVAVEKMKKVTKIYEEYNRASKK